MGKPDVLIIASLVVVAAVVGCGGLNGVIVDNATGTRYSYKQLLDQVQAFDTTVDFAYLRLTFTRTRQYDPYGLKQDYSEMRDSARVAAEDKRFAQALEFGRRALRQNFPDIETHLVMAAVYDVLDSLDKCRYHDWVYEGLIKSILSSGDGKSAETPFHVISVDEEYALIRAFRLDMQRQTLSDGGEHAYDIMELVDPETNDSLIWYFNIDIPYGRLAAMF